MKKILFLLLLISFGTYGQTGRFLDTISGVPHLQNVGTWYGKATSNGVAPLPIQIIPYGSSTTAPGHSYYHIDTLIMSSTGADTFRVGDSSSGSMDTLVWYFKGQSLYGFVCIDDSQKASSGALTDSIYVDRYDTATATWRSYMVGFRNMYDNVDYGNPLIPGNNLQKMYLINEPYPMTYRVRYASYWGNSQKLPRKTIIRWVWKVQ